MDKYQPTAESYPREYPGGGRLDETTSAATTDSILTILSQSIGKLFESTYKLESRLDSILSSEAERQSPSIGDVAEPHKVNQRLIIAVKAVDELRAKIERISSRVEL